MSENKSKSSGSKKKKNRKPIAHENDDFDPYANNNAQSDSKLKGKNKHPYGAPHKI